MIADLPTRVFDAPWYGLGVDNVLLPANFDPVTHVNDPSGLINNGNGVRCTAGNLNHNLCGSPNFATGPQGSYYLGTGSPAIDAGSQSASAAGMSTYTTQTSGALDTGTVDLGWHDTP